jgi:hypothetical protein
VFVPRFVVVLHKGVGEEVGGGGKAAMAALGRGGGLRGGAAGEEVALGRGGGLRGGAVFFLISNGRVRRGDLSRRAAPALRRAFGG